tara:strand:- start:42 stop:413 length:372 start_codon:yes stop_codon:yes gene_type:complete
MKLTREYGQFLNTQDWDYFTTLTYKWDVKKKTNRTNMDRLVNSLKKTGIAFSMFWIGEWHRSRSSTHNHLLLKGEVTTLIDNYWTSNRLGLKKYIKHLKYEQDKGATYYVTKFIDKEVEYDYV